MFCYQTSFSKKTVFLEKTEKPFVVGHDRWGGGASDDKNRCNLFCRHRCFEYFSFNNFFEKNKIFQNNNKKLLLGGMTIFEGPGHRTTKMNVSGFFFGEGEWGTKYSF